MAILANAQILGQPYVFAQLDGQDNTVSAFENALDGYLTGLWKVGALYGASAAQSYAIDVGPDVNTPTTLQAGQLNAVLTVAMSPGAQTVNILVNVVPITTQIP
jgi:phage tail sheath protein FI